MKQYGALAVALIVAASLRLLAQSSGTPPATDAIDFDVVSIKRSTTGALGNSMRSLPDGTMIATNTTIRSIISGASAEPTREVVGMPDWAMSERYDVTTKPPAGATRQQIQIMTQRMFADRFKAVVHVEQRERNGFALVVARRDGQLGPKLKPSALCDSNAAGAPPPPGPPPWPTTVPEVMTRCGGMVGQGTIASGGMPIGTLRGSLEGLAGGPITDKTGLKGFFMLELHFSRPGVIDQSNSAADPADAPDIFTALQEQLGLKLQGEPITIPVLVIDRLERPTEN